jgi:ABC-type nitrate/sulfonate/bicarbonate transport system permease component
MSQNRTTMRRYGLGALGVAVALVGWQLLVTGPLSDKPFATVPEIADALRTYAGEASFWTSLGQTLEVALVGLLLSVVAGLALGVLIGLSDFACRSLRVVTEFLKPIPPIVVLPLLVLVLGPTPKMGIFLVFFGGVFILMTQTANGVADLDPVAAETARSYRLTRRQRITHLVIPTALPFVATGVRIAAAAALVIALVSEIVGGAPGLGKDMVLAQLSGSYDQIYALVVVFGLLGMLLNGVLGFVERRVLFWHASVRTEVPA